jgi:dienelactone hydrolase
VKTAKHILLMVAAAFQGCGDAPGVFDAGDASGALDGGVFDAGSEDAAAEDASFDADREDDSGPDAGTDACTDGSHPSDGGITDSGFDAGKDAGWDAGADGGADAGKAWKGLFDMSWIRDAATAQCSFEGQTTTLKDGVLLDVWRVSYRSWEVLDGALKEILIRGYAARPYGKTGIPGIVQAHGLGGFSEQDHATGLSAKIGAFVIAYTGPGGGTVPENTSEGRPAGYGNGYRMFDTLADVRGSWFWGHAAAAMRALTCLEARSEVDGTRLGITGFSAGGVITFITAGADDRVKAAVPLSGVLAWDVAVQSPNAWQNVLLAQAGLSASSPEWNILMDQMVKPSVLMPGVAAKVMLVNGSTDEFFPLTAHNATLDSVPGADKRNSIAANFDHGCYSLTGLEDKDSIEKRAELWASGGQRMWFGHWFGTDSDFDYVPLTPVVSVTPVGGGIFVAAAVDGGGSNLDVEEVKAWGSNDDCLVFASETLEKSGGVWQKLIAFPLQANTVIFVDVKYKTRDILFPKRFSISSRPAIPNGLVPQIRSISNCLP